MFNIYKKHTAADIIILMTLATPWNTSWQQLDIYLTAYQTEKKENDTIKQILYNNK